MKTIITKILLLTLVVAMACLCFASCDLIEDFKNRTDKGDSDIDTTDTSHVKLSFEESSLELYLGDSVRLSVTATPEVKGVSTTFKSSDESVVTVSASGRATAVAAGKATITATYGSVSATCEITVLDLKISLDQDNLALDVMENPTAKLNATVSVEGMEVSWESTNNKVATVDQEGNITALDAGTTTIKAKVGRLTAECEVTVTVPEGYYTFGSANNAKAFSNPGKFFHFSKETTVLAAYFYNGEATLHVERETSGGEFFIRYQPVMEGYTDGDSFIATTTVTSSIAGYVRLGGASGENTYVYVEANTPTVVTFTTKTYKTDSPLSISLCSDLPTIPEDPAAKPIDHYATGNFTLKVAPIVATKGISINASSITIVGLDKTFTLVDEVKEGMTFESSDESIAKVDANGVITSVGFGECKITVTDGEMSAVCKVKVVDKTITMEEKKGAIDIDVSATKQLNAVASEGSTITWTSSDETIATVDANGLVTALKTGIVTITASVDEKTYVECEIIVRKSTDKIGFTSGDGTTDLGKSGQDGEWYKSGDFGVTTMKDGVLTITTTEQCDFTDNQQIRFKPVDAEGNAYVGKFYIVFTLTNNTDKDMTYTANIDKQDKTIWQPTLTLKAGESVTVIWEFERSQEEVDVARQLNIKFKKYGVGTVVMSDIYVIPVSAD